MKSASQQTHRISSVSQSAKSANPANPTQQAPFGFEGPAEHDEDPPQQGDEGDVTLPSLDLAAKRLIQKAGLTFSFSANQQFFIEVDIGICCCNQQAAAKAALVLDTCPKLKSSEQALSAQALIQAAHL